MQRQLTSVSLMSFHSMGRPASRSRVIRTPTRTDDRTGSGIISMRKMVDRWAGPRPSIYKSLRLHSSSHSLCMCTCVDARPCTASHTRASCTSSIFPWQLSKGLHKLSDHKKREGTTRRYRQTLSFSSRWSSRWWPKRSLNFH